MYNILILTEAGYEKGFGHFHRMTSIANGAIKLGIPTKMIIDGDKAARDNLERPYSVFLNWQNLNFNYNNIVTKNDIVVVDSYNVDLDQLKEIQHCCHSMIVIDDNMRLDYNNMIVLNPNYYAEFISYPINRGNTYYLGRHFLLLREDFQLSQKRKISDIVKKVLVTMGGTDPRNETSKCIQALKQIDKQIVVHVVVTSAYENVSTIRKCLGDNDKLYTDIDSKEMSCLMKSVDFTIATAGGTSNELIKMQCPSLLKVVASNQEKNAQIMINQGCFLLMSDDRVDSISKMFDYERRLEMVDNMYRFVSKHDAVELITSLALEE